MKHFPGLTRNRGWWLYQPSRRGLPDGSPRPRPIYLGTRDPAEAVARATEIRTQLDRTRAGNHLLADLIPAYISHKVTVGKYGRLTARQVTQHLTALSEILSHRAVRDISRADCLDAYGALRRTRSDATAHRYLRYLRAFFTWCIDIGYLSQNPASRLGLPTPQQSRREDFLTRERRDEIIARAMAHEAPDLQYILIAGFHLGLRIGEIVQSRAEWFTHHADRGWCTVLEPTDTDRWRIKTRRPRQIPLNRTALAFLADYPTPDDPSAYMLHPEIRPGRHTYRWLPSYRWRRFLRDAGAPLITYHTMRHTFGSLLAMAGVAEIKIVRWMGISRHTYSRHYAGLQPSDTEIDAIA